MSGSIPAHGMKVTLATRDFPLSSGFTGSSSLYLAQLRAQARQAGRGRASLTEKALDLGSSALKLLSLYIYIKEENLINNLVYSTGQFSKESFHISIKDKFLFILINI